MNIRQTAERLIRKSGTDNPFAAADFLGIPVIEYDLGGPLGHYLKYCRGKYIVIADYAPDNLRDFICAHELGHALLTEDDNTAYLTAFTGRTALSDKVERRASEFAVRFLLNERRLREGRGVSVYDLAKMRGVPPEYVELL